MCILLYSDVAHKPCIGRIRERLNIFPSRVRKSNTYGETKGLVERARRAVKQDSEEE